MKHVEEHPGLFMQRDGRTFLRRADGTESGEFFKLSPNPITREEVETALPGLYLIDEPPTHCDKIYHVAEDRYFAGDSVPMVRIDSGTDLDPRHVVNRGTFRADGKRVLWFVHMVSQVPPILPPESALVGA